MTPIEEFGKYLKELRETAGFSIKSFAYQMGLSRLEYVELEEGISIKYMTGLRSSVAPHLLYINEIPEKKQRFKKLYDDAVEYQRKFDDEIEFKLTNNSDYPTPTSASTAPPGSMPVPTNEQIQDMFTEFDGI